MEMNVGGLSCWPGGGGVAGGRSRRMDTVASGATTMKMIKSTSITSTKGVTFMSLSCPRSNLPPPPPDTFAAMEYSRAPEPFHRSVSIFKTPIARMSADVKPMLGDRPGHDRAGDLGVETSHLAPGLEGITPRAPGVDGVAFVAVAQGH